MLHVYLDTRVLPVTYDVIKFLVAADSAARISGKEKISLHVIAESFREESPRDQGTSLEEKRARVQNIYIGLSKIFPKIVSVEYTEERPTHVSYPSFPPRYNPESPPAVAYGFDLLEAVWRSGMPVQVIRPSTSALLRTKTIRSRGKYMTMTLRTSTWDPTRDGDLSIWHEAYLVLEKKLGLKIYVIPDYEDVFGGQKFKAYHWETCEWAAVEPDIRVALYSASKVNLSMAGGTTSLMYLLKDVPFISFGNLNSNSKISSKVFYDMSKWQIGTQPAWLSDGQCFDWLESDEVTPEYIVDRTIAILGNADDSAS